MQREIINLLEREGKLSSKTGEELYNIDVDDFINTVKELGLEKTDYINRDKITKNLNTEFIGQNLYIFNEVMSTNTIAKFFAENKVPEGTVIISEKQTKAKGRSDKPWVSPLGGIWLSIILNPRIDPSKAPLITLATGVAVAKTLEKMGIKDIEIKWPNDVLIKGKKVSGILTESIAKFNSLENVIVGVGIDVNLNIDSLPKELQKAATSLNIETNETLDESLIIKSFLEEFEEIFLLFQNEKFENILNQWRKRSYTIGKFVEVKEPYREGYEGYVVGIDQQGILIVQKRDNTFERVIFGECIIKNDI